MGRSLVEHRPKYEIMAPTAIRYSLARRLSIHADLMAGMSEPETAKRHGIARSTAHEIKVDPQLKEIQDPRIVEARKKAMANLYDYNSDRALSTVNQEKLDQMNAYQLTMIAAVSTDKARLLRDESTENVSVRGVVEHMQKEIEDIRKRKDNLQSEII